MSQTTITRLKSILKDGHFTNADRKELRLIVQFLENLKALNMPLYSEQRSILAGRLNRLAECNQDYEAGILIASYDL